MNRKTKTGFTLIELLVVVLIIGILAAIALPQYQKMVLRIRFSNVWQIAQNLKKGAELYYEQNGQYKDALFSESDIDYSKNCSGSGNRFVCEEGFFFDMNAGSLKIFYAPEITKSMTFGQLITAYNDSTSSNTFDAEIYFNHHSRANQVACRGKNITLCKELIGRYVKI